MLGSALIVDDEDGICQFVASFLQSTGQFNAVVVAHNGDEALAKMQNQDFVVLIMDVMMPKRDGIDVLRLLKSNRSMKKIPVVLISANFQTEIVKDAIALGVRQLLTKPFKNSDLLEKIEDAMGVPLTPTAER